MKQARFILLKGYENLKEGKRERLNELLEDHENLAYRYYLNELFRDFYRLPDDETANQLLKEWLELAWRSPFPSFYKVAKTIELARSYSAIL